MEAHERDLRYEIAWVDNNSDPAQVSALLSELPFDKVALLRLNWGIAYALNLHIFGLCSRSAYVASLEEDVAWTQHVDKRVMHMAISVRHFKPPSSRQRSCSTTSQSSAFTSASAS
jgi:hypothetical protein